MLVFERLIALIPDSPIAGLLMRARLRWELGTHSAGWPAPRSDRACIGSTPDPAPPRPTHWSRLPTWTSAGGSPASAWTGSAASSP